MANLPNKTFICNFNAKDYDASTHTIPKTTGQIFDQDLVLNANPSAYTSDHITVNGQYFVHQFSSANLNPFNRSGNQPLTIVAKTSKGFYTSGEHTIVSSRDSGNINWLLFNPANGADNSKVFLHDRDHRYYYETPCATITTEPNIYAIRVNNGSGYGMSITDNTTGSTQTVTFGIGATRVGFFTDSYNASVGFELWTGDFYWIYISNEALNDSEIQEVIDYNDGVSLRVEPNSIYFGNESGTSAVTVTSPTDWNASVLSGGFLTVLPQSGTSGSTTVYVTASKNTSYGQRIGKILITDENQDEAEINITQQESQIVVPIRKMYINGNRIN